MNKIVAHIFKNYKPNDSKLQRYGFIKASNVYTYTAELMDGQFTLQIRITNADIDAQVIDTATNEPYALFLADGACGSFVGAVRTAYETALTDIAKNCFDKCVFKSKCTQQIIEYVQQTYGDTLEFLWEKFDDNAVWRRKDNKKWYGVLLTVAKSKLGLPSEEKTEILDVRTDSDTIDALVNGNTVFKGYHMNKKHWITVCLDGSVPVQDICRMLDASYELANKK